MADPDMPFLMNSWYAMAWDYEVKATILARTVCDQEMVVYRKADGSVAVLQDLCCHRMLPLSRGRLVGDDLQCGYHGMVFNSAGQCVRIPSQDSVPAGARVRTYPVAEKWRLVWVWPGDPAQADPSSIPDLHWLDDAEWDGDGTTYDIACNYWLVLENLLDLTHETFVHPGSIGNEAVAESPIQTKASDQGVVVTRWMLDHQPAPFWRKSIGGDKNCDRWQIIRYQSPSTVTIDVGVAISGTGAPEGDRSQGITMMILNAITPETAGRTRYFWAAARNYALGTPRLTRQHRDAVGMIFLEDLHVLEAQQRAMTKYPDAPRVTIEADAGSVQAKAILRRRIAAERGKAAAAE